MSRIEYRPIPAGAILTCLGIVFSAGLVAGMTVMIFIFSGMNV